MKKIIAALLIIWAGMMVAPLVAQTSIPFWHWPVLYDAAENLVAKRGIDRDGTVNGKIYLRIDWGPCLAIYNDEFRKFTGTLRRSRYMNLRDYAAGKYEAQGWTSDDAYNCPGSPMEVKPYWRGSRPTYEFIHDAESGLWVKGKRTKYRVASPNPATAECIQYNARKANGDGTNYWQVSLEADVYDSAGTYRVGDLGKRLVTVCREQDTSVMDLRWTGY